MEFDTNLLVALFQQAIMFEGDSRRTLSQYLERKRGAITATGAYWNVSGWPRRMSKAL